MREIGSFGEVLHTFRAWVGQMRRRVRAEVRADDEERLWVFFDTEHHMAELLVCRAECAPFRYVSFQILDVRLPEHAAPVYAFYDGPNTTLSQIAAGLEEGLRVMGV